MSPQRKRSRPIDVYVRVSRVGGREGPSYISPQVQEERCRLQLKADGLEVGEVFMDDDETGRKMHRPAFDNRCNPPRNGCPAATGPCER